MFYAKLIAVNLSISFLSAGCLLFFFHYPINLLLTHTLICFSAYLISFVFSLVLGGFPRISSLRIMPLLFSIFTTILMFVYLGSWVSNHFWKANLNFGLINRVVIHYYQLYHFETILIVFFVPLIAFSLIHLLYVKLYRKNCKPLKRPFLAVLYAISALLFIAIQASTFYNNSNNRSLNKYFYGELVLDLFRKYTDSHDDYIANADDVTDMVAHSVSYVEQQKWTIQENKKTLYSLLLIA